MASIVLLQRIEKFLEKDLKFEKLSRQNATKRRELLESLKKAISAETDAQKLDEFLDQERRKSQSAETSRPNLPLPKTPVTSPVINVEKSNGVAEQEDLYIDLNIPGGADGYLSPMSPGDGSGSGYESYASDEESDTRTKDDKEEEEITRYYHGTNCDVCSQIFLENKTFLSGRKSLKRVGIIKENHFQSYKRLGDNNPELDLPLRAYNAYLGSKEGTNSMAVSLEGVGSDGAAHRFYVKSAKMQDWHRVLQDKAAQMVVSGALPSPPVASRPSSTIIPPDKQMLRQSSLIGVTSDLGKGLKTAMADMFKKDKMKKKISVAEQMGADLCGNLGVCCEGRWAKKLCMIRGNELLVYGKEEAPELCVTLHGCDLKHYFENKERQFAFKITKDGKELLFLEASSSAEMGKWVGMLIAETGCAKIPEAAENVYMEPEAYDSFLNNAKLTLRQKMKTKDSPEEEESMYVDINTTISFEEVSSTTVTSPNKSETAKKTASLERNSPMQIAHVKKHKPTKSVDASKNNHTAKAEKQKKVKSGVKKPVVDPAKRRTSSSAEENGKDKTPKASNRKEEIQHSMKTVQVKISELKKYLDASSSNSGRPTLEKAMREAEKEHKKLEDELARLECVPKHPSDVTGKSPPADKKPAASSPPPRVYPSQQIPPDRTRAASSPAPGGNVLSRLKMFENLDANK